MAGKYNFTIEQGASFQRTLTWKDGSDAPVNITGYTATLVIRDQRTEEALLTLTESSGLTLGGSAGTIQISLTPTQTAELDFISADYVLQLKNGSYEKHLLEGTVDLDRNNL